MCSQQPSAPHTTTCCWGVDRTHLKWVAHSGRVRSEGLEYVCYSRVQQSQDVTTLSRAALTPSTNCPRLLTVLLLC
jgi:hypothetical protein